MGGKDYGGVGKRGNAKREISGIEE